MATLILGAWSPTRKQSTDYYTQQFGAYPHGQRWFVEQPGDSVSLHAVPVNISYEEGLSLLNPGADPRDIDVPFAVAAREVAHQWWRATLTPAPVEGAAVLTESLAWYSALFPWQLLSISTGNLRQSFRSRSTICFFDLFEANTFWKLATQRVTAKQTGTGAWQVTLDMKTRKMVVDIAGVETEVPIDDLIEVGVFPAAGLGEPLHLQMHRVRSGEHRITVTVASKPARAGIDPRNLLIDVGRNDNLKEITHPEGPKR